MTEGERASKRPKRMRRAERDALRSHQTRTRLLEAALEVLVERGYAGFNTVAVCERAQAPRGTMLHHFPSRASLLVASLEHVLSRRLERYAETMRSVVVPDPGTEDAARVRRALFDRLWAEFVGPATIAWLELAIASRTDPELAAQFGGVVERFDRSVRQAYLAIFPGAAAAEAEGRSTLPFVFATLNGLGLERTYRKDLDVGPMLDVLARIGEIMPARPSQTQSDESADAT